MIFLFYFRFEYSYQTWAFPFGSPLVQFLNPTIRKIIESGCIQKLYHWYGSEDMETSIRVSIHSGSVWIVLYISYFFLFYPERSNQQFRRIIIGAHIHPSLSPSCHVPTLWNYICKGDGLETSSS